MTLTEKSVVGVGLADGKLLWQILFVPQGRAYNAATPIVDGQTVICVGQGRGVRALKIKKHTGGWVAKDLWSNADLAVQHSSPVLKDGMLYAISDKGNLWCMDAKTGQALWTDPARGGACGPMLDVGSAILSLTEKSELIAFKPGEKQYVELVSNKVADTTTYAAPVVAGNAIYVKDQDAVTMWTME